MHFFYIEMQKFKYQFLGFKTFNMLILARLLALQNSLLRILIEYLKLFAYSFQTEETARNFRQDHAT